MHRAPLRVYCSEWQCVAASGVYMCVCFEGVKGSFACVLQCVAVC